MPTIRPTLAAALAAAALAVAPLAATPLHAQNGRVAISGSRVPPGHLPPAGLCRVWYEGVPPGRQPAPTSCDAAERQAARGGRSASVIYGRGARRGDDRRERDGRWDDRYDPRHPNGRYEDGRNRAGERPDPRRDDGRWDRDGRSDGRWDDRYDDRYDRRLPTMPTITVLRRGSGESAEWLGRGEYRARWTDADRNGRPEQVWWSDAHGSVVQLWTDANRDGRVDRITFYRNGHPVRTVG